MTNVPRKLPKQTAKDVVYASLKGALGELPGGSMSGELLALVISPPLAKRMDEFLEGLAQDIADLQNRVEQLQSDRLANNELFITATVQATQIAIRNHQSEKLEALRYSVLNTAMLTESRDDMVQTFLAYVDTLTVSHIKVLDYFYDPKIWGTEHNVNWPDWSSGGVLAPLRQAMPEIDEDFAKQIIRDLQTRGLLADFTTGATLTDSGMFASRTTSMGNDFLVFIKKPAVQ